MAASLPDLNLTRPEEFNGGIIPAVHGAVANEEVALAPNEAASIIPQFMPVNFPSCIIHRDY